MARKKTKEEVVKTTEEIVETQETATKVDTMTEEFIKDVEAVGGVMEVVEEIKVYDKRGKYIRTYSKEVHGKDYKKLAEQFASKGYVIK